MKMPKDKKHDNYSCRYSCAVVILLCTGVVHYYDRTFLSWPLVVIVGILVLILILPMLRDNLEEINKDGVKFREPPSSGMIPPTEGTQLINFSMPEKIDISELTSDALNVLAVLWIFQINVYGKDDPRRWGFSVGETDPNYYVFTNGRNELDKRKLIRINEKGLVGLSDEGLYFCKSDGIDAQLRKIRPLWNAFQPI